MMTPEQRVQEHIIFTDEYRNQLIERMIGKQHIEYIAKDIRGRYYSGELLSMLLKKAEANGVHLRYKANNITGNFFNSDRVLKHFGL